MGNMKLPQNTIMLRQRCSPIKFFQYLFWTSSIVSCQQLSQANIGFMFPIQYNGLIHPLGPAALAAAMMAVDEINRKREGVEDGMLPKTKLKMIIRSPGSVFTLGAMSAINMMYRDMVWTLLHVLVLLPMVPSKVGHIAKNIYIFALLFC